MRIVLYELVHCGTLLYLPVMLLGLSAAAALALGVFWVRITASRRLSWSSPGAKPLVPVGAETGVEALTSRLVPVSTRAFTCELKRKNRFLL